MSREELRGAQAPLKSRYQADPGSALVTLRAGISDARIVAEGDLDFRGTLGVDRTAPVGFRQIRLSIRIDAELPEDSLRKLLALTERYCVVYQTLRGGTDIRLDATG